MKNNQELLNEYLLSIVVEKGLSKNTLLAYKNDLTFFLNYLKENNTFILDIDHYQVNEYIEYLQDNKLAIKSIKRKVSALKNFFIYLTLHENFKYDFSYFESLKEEEYLPKFVLQEDMNRVLDSLKTDTFIEIRNKAICELMYATGIRVSELVSLKRDNVSFVNQTIKVNGKGAKERIIPFSEKCSKWLLLYLEKLKTLEKKGNNSYLFITKNNKQVTRQEIYILIKETFEEQGIKNVTPHTLRHSFASNLLSQGCPLMIVKTLLGHEDIKTTQIYTHVENKKIKSIYDTIMK